MFKKTTYRNRTILFISSYFPMFLIIIIQNGGSLIKQISESGAKNVFLLLEFYVIIFFIFLSVLSFRLLKKMLNELKDYKDESFPLKVLAIKNVNYQYVITYFSVYIFPFITIDFCTVVGILQFALLWGLIGYIYIKNNLIYINPTLNIFFKYNLYETEMEYEDEDGIISISAILLSKKDRNNIKKVTVIKESEGLYIES